MDVVNDTGRMGSQRTKNTDSEISGGEMEKKRLEIKDKQRHSGLRNGFGCAHTHALKPTEPKRPDRQDYYPQESEWKTDAWLILQETSRRIKDVK